MSSLEEKFQQACDARDIPGVVLLAQSADGKFKYENAFGLKSPTEKMTLDSTFLLASCTKLMTSICVLQCIERGQIAIDDDVSTVLSELKDVQILTGFDEKTDQPILVNKTNIITIRQMLSHSSGLGSDHMSPRLARWRKFRGEKTGPEGRPMLVSISCPLLFEPGTSWMYGSSLDWAGLLVMRLNSMSLEAYMQKYIWTPLGIQDITFHNKIKPDVRKKLVHMTKRGSASVYGASASVPSDEKVNWADKSYHSGEDADEFGGGGAFGSAVEYMKILHSISSDDGKLLKSESIDEMFSPQLTPDAQDAWARFRKMFTGSSNLEPGAQVDYGLGGLLISRGEGTDGKGGTLRWSGRPNLYWMIDRAKEISTFYASNIVPYGDAQSRKMQQLFEQEMYSRISKA